MPWWRSELCGCSPSCMLQCTQAFWALHCTTNHCRCFQAWRPSCWSACTHGESLIHLGCKTTIATACDLLTGQALGMSMEAIWTFAQLDMLLQDKLQDLTMSFAHAQLIHQFEFPLDKKNIYIFTTALQHLLLTVRNNTVTSTQMSGRPTIFCHLLPRFAT